MQIVTDVNELRKAIPSGTSVASVGMQPKTVKAFHAGHRACISKAKEIADLVVVFMWDDYGARKQLFDEDDSKYSKFNNEVFPLLEKAGVDVIYDGTKINTLEKFFNDTSLRSIINTVEQRMLAEGYNIQHHRNQLKYMFCCYEVINIPFKRVACWADGYWRFIQKWYVEKYHGTKVYLIGPARDQYDNLIHSSKLLCEDKEAANSIKATLLPNRDIKTTEELEIYISSLNIPTIKLERFERYELPDNRIYLWALFRVGNNKTGFEEARIIS